jgi:hypothetical protein
MHSKLPFLLAVSSGRFFWLQVRDYKGRRVQNPLYMGLEKPWKEVIPNMLEARGLLLNRGEVWKHLIFAMMIAVL